MTEQNRRRGSAGKLTLGIFIVATLVGIHYFFMIPLKGVVVASWIQYSALAAIMTSSLWSWHSLGKVATETLKRTLNPQAHVCVQGSRVATSCLVLGLSVFMSIPGWPKPVVTLYALIPAVLGCVMIFFMTMAVIDYMNSWPSEQPAPTPLPPHLE
jgi:hypothetical protein